MCPAHASRSVRENPGTIIQMMRPTLVGYCRPSPVGKRRIRLGIRIRTHKITRAVSPGAWAAATSLGEITPHAVLISGDISIGASGAQATDTSFSEKGDPGSNPGGPAPAGLWCSGPASMSPSPNPISGAPMLFLVHRSLSTPFGQRPVAGGDEHLVLMPRLARLPLGLDEQHRLHRLDVGPDDVGQRSHDPGMAHGVEHERRQLVRIVHAQKSAHGVLRALARDRRQRSLDGAPLAPSPGTTPDSRPRTGAAGSGRRWRISPYKVCGGTS